MQYWLMKSEPDVFSFSDLKASGQTAWDGVRNHLAARHMRAMRIGDRAFFYHSNIGKCIVGIMDIVRPNYPDPSDQTGKFVLVDVAYAQALPNPVTLAQIKTDPLLKTMELVRQSRLSVCPVTSEQWARVLAVAHAANSQPGQQ